MNYKRVIFSTVKVLFKYKDDRKHLAEWYKTLEKGRSPLTDGSPFITYSAAAWLEQYLDKTKKVFEYGSGGSTMWLASRVGYLHSIEHNQDWANIVTEKLQAAKYDHCRLTYAPSADITTPVKYELGSNTTHGTDHKDFSEYVQAIDQYEDGYFDLVIVDGRARISCIKQALSKVKKGGYIMLDDSQRPRYTPAFEYLSQYKHQDFRGISPYKEKVYTSTVWNVV